MAERRETHEGPEVERDEQGELETDLTRHRGDTTTAGGERPVEAPDEGGDVEEWRKRDRARGEPEDPGGYF